MKEMKWVGRIRTHLGLLDDLRNTRYLKLKEEAEDKNKKDSLSQEHKKLIWVNPHKSQNVLTNNITTWWTKDLIMLATVFPESVISSMKFKIDVLKQGVESTFPGENIYIYK